MNAKMIQRAVIASIWRRSFVMPNYTPKDWFECDVMEITEAGFLREYEIKMTRGDFNADAKKAKRLYNWRRGEGLIEHPTATKHQRINTRDEHGPAQFWFVVPETFVPADSEVPDWAGLIVASYPAWRGRHLAPVLNETRKAPRLHRAKADGAIKQHASGSAYWRFIRHLVEGKHHGETEQRKE